METFFSWIIAGVVLLIFVVPYWLANKRKEAKARSQGSWADVLDGPRAQHPQIQADYCIGCGACVAACPEGDVLALINGKASILNAHKCIGHSLCAEECPVGAITMVMATASAKLDLPYISAEMESSIPNLFIAGELGGLALIKNAVNQGRDSVDVIANRIGVLRNGSVSSEVYDVLIVGAGPAGISASPPPANTA